MRKYIDLNNPQTVLVLVLSALVCILTYRLSVDSKYSANASTIQYTQHGSESEYVHGTWCIDGRSF